MTPAQYQLLLAEAAADDRRITSEAELQRAVAAILDRLGLLWMHPANERKCSPAQGRMLKLAGVKAGVPDVLVFTHGLNTGTPLAIELKHVRGKCTQSQDEWHENLYQCGWNVQVCRSVEQVVALMLVCGYVEVDK